MVANVYDYAERLRVVLRQIKSRLEQQYNYAPDLAEVSNTPFLSDSDIKPAKSIEVFFSYSHKDEELRDELEKHLSILKRQGVITGWHDRRIGAGREWAGEIDTHLNTADVILLLISSDFLASDYCYDVEMKRAMERHEAGEARVIPVILRPVDWKGAPFGKLQALPTDAKPVTEWPNRDGAFLNVAQGIRAAVEELVGPSKVPTQPPIQESPLAEPWMPTTLEEPRRGCYAEYGRMLKFAILLLVPLVIGGILMWSGGGPLPTIIAMLSTTPRPAVKPTVAGVVGGTVVSRASDTPSPTVVPTEAPPTATATVISTPTVSATASPKPVKATSTPTPTPTRPAPTATPTQQPTAKPTPKIIDTMDSISGWSEYKDDKGSSIEIESESGKTNNAVKISFSLKKDGWVGISKPLYSGLLVGTRAIGFSYKGSGAPNTIELKLIYTANAQGKEAVFSIFRNHVTNASDWTSLEVPYAEFACWPDTGCDAGSPLDVSRVQRIDFAISNKPGQGDTLGAGVVSLDDVQALK
jgi:hypothetical protein